MEEYLTTGELSQRLKTSPGTIRNWVCSGKLILNVHYVKPSARKILFVWSAIEAWLYEASKAEQVMAVPRHGSCPENKCLINI